MNRRPKQARRWYVSGRVQGVGFRYFVQRAAAEIGVRGYARNLEDGRVEVFAMGAPAQLTELAGRLHTGPRWADVRAVEEREAAPESAAGFLIE